ncbi:auxin transporter protein 1-like [Magnolia sinica]|uniref:auxin transporter protein 1-like n=1 Tax=Magnolia sinica TaxID=86752 RepID=UPI00265A5D5F|nr:auxin transporter protein 1-like [Magnolia sinica]
MTGEELGIRLIGAERDMVGSNREEKGTEEKTTLFRRVWNGAVWHGGSVYDAWLNSVAIQVGSLILTLPYTFAQMGYWFGIGLQLLYGAFGCWSVYLISLFHA